MFKKIIWLSLMVCLGLGMLFNLAVNAKEGEPKMEKAVFAAGCFWGVEEHFRTLKGVISTRVGYCGGDYCDPDYQTVCTGRTNHAESVEIEYNPNLISYNELLKVFWTTHDPTTPNRQGPDFGTQYRSIIFYTNKDQEKLANESKLKMAKSFQSPIVTEILPLSDFYQAEEYHQKYLFKHGQNMCH